MENLDQLLIREDLSSLEPEQRAAYYTAVCQSLGLNPLTRPFGFLELDGKLVLYTKRDCTDQLRKLHSISIKILSRELVDSVYIVTAQAATPEGRTDESIGAVPLVKEKGDWKTSQGGKRYFQGTGEFSPLPPDARANAVMKAETKSKRRVTLSICGLGMLDESEIETVPNARVKQPEQIQEEQKLIDVGNNPMNSREAQAYVLDRKLKDLNADPEAQVTKSYARVEPPSVPASLATLHTIPEEVVEIWKRMTSIDTRCEEFRKLKKELQEVAGKEEGEICYYNKLALFDKAKHANEIAKRPQDSRKCAAELWTAIQNYKIADNKDISDEDIPR